MFSLGYRVSSLHLPLVFMLSGPAYAALIMSKQVHVAGAEHCIHVPSSEAQYVECPLRDREAHGPRHTKVIYNVTSCSPLGTQIFGVGLGLSV